MPSGPSTSIKQVQFEQVTGGHDLNVFKHGDPTASLGPCSTL